MSDRQVCEIDPGSDLYPFMVVACNDANDLDGTYYLLRRNPSLVSHGFDGTSVGMGLKRRTKARSTAERNTKKRK